MAARSELEAEVMGLSVDLVRTATALAATLGSASGLAPSDVVGLRALDALGGGDLSVGVLGRELGLSPAAATGLVDRLEAAGLAARTHDASDRRRVKVGLTASARGFAAQHLRPLASRIQRAVAVADEAELAAISRFLRTALGGEDAEP